MNFIIIWERGKETKLGPRNRSVLKKSELFEKIGAFYSARGMTTSKLSNREAFPSNRTGSFTILPLPVDLNGHLPLHIYFLGAESTGFSQTLLDPLFSLLTIKSPPLFWPNPTARSASAATFSISVPLLSATNYLSPTLTIDIHRHSSMEFEIVFDCPFWERLTMAEFDLCCSDVQDFAFVSKRWTRRTIVFVYVYICLVCLIWWPALDGISSGTMPVVALLLGTFPPIYYLYIYIFNIRRLQRFDVYISLYL